MKILLVTDEVWNDDKYPNNVLTNWFEDFNAEFAQIYCSPGIPKNNVCKKYFQITDMMMFKSIISKTKAGIINDFADLSKNNANQIEIENPKLYSALKSITTEFMRAIRELLWCIGKYDCAKLEKFIADFNPDIVFCPRYATLKLLRLEKCVMQLTNAPFVAFTGDDEYSLKQIRLSPIYWIMKIIKRCVMKKQIPHYSLYYCHSLVQAEIYAKTFKIPTKVLYKCGVFSKESIHKTINLPLKFVYAGKLYCNRWKSLSLVAKAIKRINNTGSIKATLEIYTMDKLTKRQKRLLNDNKNTFIRNYANAAKLREIYCNSDVCLHIEGFDLKNKLLTKYSFSSKIIDCLASGCAVMAVCPNQHTGYIYLHDSNAAITVCNKKALQGTIHDIIKNTDIILQYAKNAYELGNKKHTKSKIHAAMYTDFENIAISEIQNENNAN